MSCLDPRDLMSIEDNIPGYTALAVRIFREDKEDTADIPDHIWIWLASMLLGISQDTIILACEKRLYKEIAQQF